MTYEQRPDYIIDSASKAYIPSIDIYRNPTLRAFYEEFQQQYRQPETIVRNRGGKEITYAPEVYDGISLDGRHMFSVRMPQTSIGTVLTDTQRYFVVSGDFHTLESTEWWLQKVDAKTLYLSLHPINEVAHTMPVDDGKFSLTAIKQRRLAEHAAADADYSAIRLTIGNGASISWGNGERPEALASFATVASQLETLRTAEYRERGIGHVAHEYSQEQSEVA